MDASDESVPIRLDRWLWAARFYKTRPRATAAVKAGHVRVDDSVARAGRRLRGGERLIIRCEGVQREILVLGLSGRRGPAAVARLLYRESAASLAAVAAARDQHRQELRMPRSRPGRRDRRLLAKLKRRGD